MGEGERACWTTFEHTLSRAAVLRFEPRRTYQSLTPGECPIIYQRSENRPGRYPGAVKRHHNWQARQGERLGCGGERGGHPGHLVTCMALREAGERHHDNAGGSRKLSTVVAGHTMHAKEWQLMIVTLKHFFQACD